MEQVRKQARLIVYDTLQSFVATPLLLGPATKTIMDLFMNKYPIRPTSDGRISLKARDTFDLVIVCLGVMSIEDRTCACLLQRALGTAPYKSYKAHHRCSAQTFPQPIIT